MAVSSPNADKIEPSQSMESSPSRRVSDVAPDFSGELSSTADSSDPNTINPDLSDSSLNPSKELEFQPQPSLRSEEYRQLFRLPPDEVLIQDFNCALQENFLLQGHMYLFVHSICFYSNLFGFETKKIISFHEITSVRRAKTAGIFPTAIEIIAGGKKYFFTSFLSRDEAFKLINDGWLQHCNEAKSITDQQESKSELNSQENGIVATEKASDSIDSKLPVDEPALTEGGKDVSISEDCKLPPNGEAETASSGASEYLEEDSEVVVNPCSSSSIRSSVWEQDNSDAPKVPEYYTKVAESKFPVIRVEEFFNHFFSDDSVVFTESFHKRCGDKDFSCSSWYPHDEFGHARDVSFQHPIKLYLGARFGSCQEFQKFRVYRNSHLVFETSQQISDVPYGDYFRVEALWDMERDGDESKECCILRVYVNVAFSKKTMFKGKIVQSTVDECRDAYAIWINIAHELLKQKKVEKDEAEGSSVDLIPNGQFLERQSKTGEQSENSQEESDLRVSQVLPDSEVVNVQGGDPLQRNLSGATSVASLFRESMVKFYLSLKSQNHVPLLFVITFALILLLMQLSIVVLLTRPQQIQVFPQTDCTGSSSGNVGERGAETVAWMEKRIHHLKDEMLMIETLLEKMGHEHTLLKAQLKDLEHLKDQYR
ncbi:protein VASCULAR ASSOCIATED DEATH 1, chloroplastic isoform X3 [Cornus florida]|uniref:protein VASCULAR ASSOCIATED DEATH 1, chloroplastic isoform X3 n=1 Tax=Cornus florida TaxID=4283 RepID=UPI0028974876|nr:protein VASCULAR ASSOCIATED DEATH 1, chloroplastic isoform X3 [Cornus florida]